MLPHKTEQARTALQAHRAPLDMRQRRLLILCDGQRDLGALTALLGQETPTMVNTLVSDGYLTLEGSGAAATRLVAPLTAAAATAGPNGAPVAAAPPPPSASSGRRRSMAAARIYLLGILEMQRHPRAAQLFRDLQQTRADDDVVSVMGEALQALPDLTSPGYVDRVRARLLEVLPEAHCSTFAETA